MPLSIQRWHLIDQNGNEVIKIADGAVAPKSALTNVSKPANTKYKSEDYFIKAAKLNKGEVYISHVTGWYVNKAEFEKGKRFTGNYSHGHADIRQGRLFRCYQSCP